MAEEETQGYQSSDGKVLVDSNTPGMWRYELFGCFDNIGLCCLGYFCPCLLIGDIAQHFGESKWFIVFLTLGLGCNFLPTLRAMYREQRQIPGSIVGDYIYGYFCAFCLAIQLKKEIDGTAVQTMEIERK